MHPAASQQTSEILVLIVTRIRSTVMQMKRENRSLSFAVVCVSLRAADAQCTDNTKKTKSTKHRTQRVLQCCTDFLPFAKHQDQEQWGKALRQGRGCINTSYLCASSTVVEANLIPYKLYLPPLLLLLVNYNTLQVQDIFCLILIHTVRIPYYLRLVERSIHLDPSNFRFLMNHCQPELKRRAIASWPWCPS
jgi:hypothetical protein